MPLNEESYKSNCCGVDSKVCGKTYVAGICETIWIVCSKCNNLCDIKGGKNERPR